MMSDISDLEARIKSAMNRIELGLNGLEAPGPGIAPEDVARLQGQLDEEREVREELEGRLVSLQEAHDLKMSEIGAQGEAARIQMQDLDDTLQRLRQANAQLRENNQALRQANEEGVADPHLINNSMLAELEALRSSRAADKAEADAIVGALRPMLRAAQDAGGV